MRTRFFTGAGDKGASRIGAKKFKKDNGLFDALGALDRVNSCVGWCVVEAKKERVIRDDLIAIQEMLFVAQAEIAASGFGARRGVSISAEHVKALEAMIVRADKKIPAIKKFVLPGGSELAARLDIARAVARDAERALVRFDTKKQCSQKLLSFVNRLSSALFAEARLANVLRHAQERNPAY